MSNFYELFLSAGSRAPASILARLAAAATHLFKRRKRRGRRRETAAPPIYLGDNRMRRDLGLPPVDRHGWPL
jgi:hypothetical protein